MADKRISQLNSHTTPSGSDLLVIVNNNETKKITYADLSSTLTGSQTNISALNTFTQSIDGRVDNLESWSSSLDSTFATDLQVSIVSSSVAATIGIVSQNTGLVTTSSFNSYTASQSTGSLVDRLNDLESVTSSYELKGSGILSGSISYNDLTNIPSGIVSQSTDLSSINSFTQSIDSRVDNLESWSSSLDSTFATDLQVSIVSSSVAATIGIVSQNTGLVTTASFNEYTASQSTSSLVDRLNTIENETGSYLTNLNGTISGSSQLTSSFDTRYTLSGSIPNIPTGSFAITGSNTFIGEQIISSSLIVTNEIKGIGNIFLQPDVNDARYFQIYNTAAPSGNDIHFKGNTDFNYFGDDTNYLKIDDSAQTITITGVNGVFVSSSLNVTDSINGTINATNGVISGSSQLTSSFDTRYTLSGSVVSGTTPAGTVSGSSQLTSSYDTRYTLSGSVSAVPSGTISGSSQLTSSFDGRYVQTGSFNAFTASALTTGSNSFNGNQTITGSLIVSSVAVVNGAVTIPTGSTISLTSGSNLFVDSSGAITGSLTGSVFGIGDVSAFSSSINTRLNNITSTPAGTVSGSSQLTSSYDSRYSLSGSVLTSFSSSVDNRLDTLEASIISGSINYTQVLGNRRTGITTTGVSIISGSITTTGNPVQIMITGDANPTTTAWCRLQIFRDGNGIGNIIQVENSSNLNVPYCLNVIDTPSAGTYTYSMRTVDSMSGTFDFGEHNGPLLTAVELKSNTQLPSGLISGSSQLTSSYDTRYTLSGSVQPLPSGLISGSSQLTSSYDTRYAPSASYLTNLNGAISSSSQVLGGSGIYSSSAQLPSGLISGSSQLTASYDTRYTLSGSVLSGTTPAGTISGSSQLTSSFDGRYTQTGSFNTLTSSFNSFTASAQSVTTGSNTFNGTQTITGSLNITTGNIIASAITANTSSLYLTSGSNLYVQNNGIVEITGSLIVSGSTIFKAAGGFEGGEIALAYALSGSTLTGSAVSVDIYQNRLRIFEGGGDARGVHIDLSKTPGGVAGELMWKASGLVNAGVDVTLGNLKARLASSGNYSLQVSTIVGTYSVYGSSVYSYNGIGGVTLSSPLTITTTPAYLASGYNFLVAGSTDTWIITDTSAGIAWRISLMIGPSFTNNMITIERLV